MKQLSLNGHFSWLTFQEGRILVGCLKDFFHI